MKWENTLLQACYQVINAGGGEVQVVFSYRHPNKLVPIIRIYPHSQKICEEIEIEED